MIIKDLEKDLIYNKTDFALRYIQDLSVEDKVRILESLTDDLYIKIVKNLSPRIISSIIPLLSNERKIITIEKITPLNRVRVFRMLAKNEQSDLFALIPLDSAKKIKYQLGGLPSTALETLVANLYTVESNLSIKQIKKELSITKNSVNKYIYVLNYERKLEGVISIKNILRSKESLSIKDVMKKNLITINKNDSFSELKNISYWDKFSLLPVVSDENYFIGGIRLEDVYRVSREYQMKKVSFYSHVLEAIETFVMFIVYIFDLTDKKVKRNNFEYDKK